jgi:hypothetical protein
MLVWPVVAADRSVPVSLETIEDECEVDSLLDSPLVDGVGLHQLEKEKLSLLQLRIARLLTQREHRHSDALVNLGFSDIEAPHG